MSKIELVPDIWWPINWDEETEGAIEGARRVDFIVYAYENNNKQEISGIKDKPVDTNIIIVIIIIIIVIIITITKFSNLIGYQLPWFQP